MKIDKQLRTQIEIAFAPLNRVAAAQALPPICSLSSALQGLLPKQAKAGNINLKPAVATLFTTAAVEIWMRAVHSFLISASLTEASPIWASTTGYYSSHYSIRALAHLLGYFQLFKAKKTIRLGSKYVCSFESKQAGDREHRFYWKIVKQDPHFAGDPLFTDNTCNDDDTSDVAHRDRSNYADHVFCIPTFKSLDAQILRERVEYISQIAFTVPPIPRLSEFPDVQSVQIVAYHRMVRFRQFLDAILGGNNRFWKINRNPSWCADLIDFQLIEQGTVGSIYN